MIEILYLYIFIGVIVMLWCMAWAYGDAKVPIYSFFIIVLIWPYQLYLQRRSK